MRIFILAVAVVVSGCATVHHRECPPLPTIGDNELLKDYTLKVVQMYNACRDEK
jgi:uncharacterized protein YceK